MREGRSSDGKIATFSSISTMNSYFNHSVDRIFFLRDHTEKKERTVRVDTCDKLYICVYHDVCVRHPYSVIVTRTEYEE